MKKILYSTLWAALIVMSQTSCKPIDDTVEPNVVVDEKGVKIELTWSNSATNPITNTDLDMVVIDKVTNKQLLSSNNYSKFESIELLPKAVSDGEYDLGVYVSNIDRQSNYTISVIGLSTGKVWSQSFGPIYVNDRNTTLKPKVLKVSQTKFKVY
jgi:hypothetical protein